MAKVDDRQYWKDRHAQVDDLKASGLQSAGLSGNQLIYKILRDQYKKLLDRVGMGDVKTILDCGFGDGYFLKFFKENYPSHQVFGIDISPAAKDKIDFIPKTRLFVGDLTGFDLKKRFDLVHCFDVLYHILDEQDYVNALSNICKHSSKYVVLHERFLEKAAIISSPHVRFRRREFTDQVLNANGFSLVSEIPSHFFAMRPLTFTLNRFMAGTLYSIDRYIATNLSSNLQERLASHFIRVYKKSE